MRTQTTSESAILFQAIRLVKETRFRASLTDKPFVLGLLVEHKDGLLAQTLRKHEDEFKKIGAELFEWRDDALRGRSQIAGEELVVSVRRHPSIEST
jgi:hypothetical protein